MTIYIIFKNSKVTRMNQKRVLDKEKLIDKLSWITIFTIN